MGSGAPAQGHASGRRDCPGAPSHRPCRPGICNDEAPPPYEESPGQEHSFVEKYEKKPSSNGDQSHIFRLQQTTASNTLRPAGHTDTRRCISPYRKSELLRALPSSFEPGPGSLSQAYRDLFYQDRLAPNETLTDLIKLCQWWKTFDSLDDKIKAEAPYALSLAVKGRSAALLDLLLPDSVDLDFPDKLGKRPLMQACELNYADIVKRLLDAGASVQYPPMTETPLHSAAVNNNLLVVGYLLDAGADVDALNEKGNTALFRASSGGHAEIVKKLLARGAQIDYGAPNLRPLHRAVNRDDTEMVKILLDGGASLESRCLNFTPVLNAVHFNREETLGLLLQRGADPNPRINLDFALHHAARKGFRGIVTMLLDAGVPVDSPSDLGLTALQKAAAGAKDDIIDRLLARGADINARTKYGYTALHVAAWQGHAKIVKQLLYAGASIGSATRSGHTALHNAVYREKLDATNVLLDHGADPNVDSPASTILFQAVKCGNRDIVKRLVESGADVNQEPSKGATPVFITCFTGNQDLFEYLLDHGANACLASDQGYTPLHVASARGHLTMVERIVRQHPMSAQSASMHGLTPLHLAASRDRTAIIKVLLSKGADPNALCLGNTSPLAIAVRNHRATAVSNLLPLTMAPLMLDCFGKSTLDWAQSDDSLLNLLRADPRTAAYIPTTESAQRAHLRAVFKSLIDGLLVNQQPDDARFINLGRCLLFLHDITEAEHAFQLTMYEEASDAPPPSGFLCELCDQNIVGELNVCLICADYYLCGECMCKHREVEGKGMVIRCSGHRFQRIEHRHWEGEFKWPLEGLVNGRAMSVEAWLKHVRSAYSNMEL